MKQIFSLYEFIACNNHPIKLNIYLFCSDLYNEILGQGCHVVLFEVLYLVQNELNDFK